jgi:hypothetical protein
MTLDDADWSARVTWGLVAADAETTVAQTITAASATFVLVSIVILLLICKRPKPIE